MAAPSSSLETWPPSAEVKLDWDRRRRTGLDEAVFAAGKSLAQLTEILQLAAAARGRLLFTRLAPDQFASLDATWRAQLDYCSCSRTAFFGAPSQSVGAAAITVGVVAAGSSDVPVAREAARTLEFNGMRWEGYFDVGVAGLWRLTERVAELRRHAVLIAVAGMDAALPTVLGGLVPGLLIAVPTSIGYGVASGGHAALHAILASCAPGICVVNIDNGYGAACAALRALRLFDGANPMV